MAGSESLDPETRASALEKQDMLEQIHDEAARTGQSEVPSAAEDVNLHFIAFVEKNGNIYHLDGRLSGPLCHGPTSKSTFLKDVGRVIRENFTSVDPERYEVPCTGAASLNRIVFCCRSRAMCKRTSAFIIFRF